MKAKGDVGADLYIEDTPSNISALEKLGKSVLIFTNSTNKDVKGLRANSWEEAEEKILEKLAEWQEAKDLKSGSKS
jgi:5'(3')-deoxyribonucleotidase